VTEKYYRAKAEALLLQELILPISDKPTIVCSGSHDLALEKAGEALAEYFTLLTLPVGSLDGLANLRQGLCQVSGAHLLDTNGEYNTPFVRHLFPDRAMDIITFAYRTQGLLVAPGNPKGVRNVSDLAQTGLRFINRNPGSGTRLWLDRELERLYLPSESIEGYGTFVNTHTACARAIVNGQADAALGLQASAVQHNLGFIPLFEERYDLILPREQETVLAPLLDYLQTAQFQQTVSALPGYATTHSGEQVLL
ncbi:MAG: molybdopterin biosynthesis protein, partial [Anaerolineales bacterium]|nr:molybdopterin biosynthesis protein [Anaerolineales bacterium]